MAVEVGRTGPAWGGYATTAALPDEELDPHQLIPQLLVDVQFDSIVTTTNNSCVPAIKHDHSMFALMNPRLGLGLVDQLIQ